MEEKALLRVENLHVTFEPKARAVRGVSLEIREREVHGLVGESGSGKTVTSSAVMGILPEPPARINMGKIIFKGKNILELEEEEKRSIRGKEIAMVFQEPAKYLNPAFKIGEQIGEMLRLHLGMSRSEALERTLEILGLVGLGADKRILNSYPHELSGGMKQRAMIAMAISCNPSLVIADEPTTALDVTLQRQILKLIEKLKESLNMSILFISHDLGIVREIANKISVIYAGKIVENAGKEELFEKPLHPYTKLLLLSIPDPEKRGRRLKSIPGKVPDASSVPSGCAFHPRCPIAEDICSAEEPPLVPVKAGENVRGLHLVACHFTGKKWIE